MTLTILNDLIRKLHDEVQSFEHEFWNAIDAEPTCICITIQARAAYHGYNFYLEVEIPGENSWTREWHDKFCKKFNVVLDCIQKRSVKTENNYGDGFNEKWIYIYKPAGWKDYRNLEYDDMKVVEFKSTGKMNTLWLDVTIREHCFTDTLPCTVKFYNALKDCSPNNSHVRITREVHQKLSEAAIGDREKGLMELLAIDDVIKFKKHRR